MTNRNLPNNLPAGISEKVKRLSYLCDIVPPLLGRISNEDFTQKSAPGKWSKQEILGHLVDSATNNHHRLIRAQIEDTPAISYNQDKWNACSSYNTMDRRHLIDFWEVYNRHILFVVHAIPEEAYTRTCIVSKAGDPVTIEWIIIDYVTHLEHHLKQLVSYS